MTRLKNKTILITGGDSGIGKIMSRWSLDRKAKVINWDINTQNTENTLRELSPLGNITFYLIDISDLQQIKTTAQQLKKNMGILIY